jgi:rhodanese-related sulfurtransferase
MRTTYRDLIAAAEACIETLAPEAAIDVHEAAANAGAGPDTDPHGNTLFIDLRDIRELWREGTIPGAAHCPRGMLEFWIDPESPYHKPIFSKPDTRYVFFCQSGWRSALATRTAQEMGLAPVAHIGGGFRAWVDGGGPVVAVERPS